MKRDVEYLPLQKFIDKIERLDSILYFLYIYTANLPFQSMLYRDFFIFLYDLAINKQMLQDDATRSMEAAS